LKIIFRALPFALLVFLVLGCAGKDVKVVYSAGVLNENGSWVLLPMLNHSNMPEAGLKAEAMIVTLLRKRLQSELLVYPKKSEATEVLDLNQWRRFNEAKEWAEKRSVRYGLSGSVQEWRYKRGLEGEPVVAVMLELTDLKNSEVIWSASSASVGSFRESVSGVGQQLLSEMLATLEIKNKKKE